jgi:dTDP-4-dehydrorhamnose reductase
MSAARVAWITGAGGLLGNYFTRSAPAQWQARPITRADADLLDFAKVRELFDAEKPSLIIHCAAISKNPACDADPALARRVNTEATANLASLASDIPFLYVSTDLVFDGTKGNYVETDPVNPLSIYAETKVRAEEAVLKNPLHTVVRTSLNAGRSLTRNRSFNEEMRAAFEAGRVMNLFADEFRCPIPAETTVRAIWEIAGEAGLYHLCGAEKLSRAQIGELLAAHHVDLNPMIVRGSLRDYKGSPRPPDTSMKCGKIQAKLSFPLPKFSDWIRAQPPGSL